ncbi:hypothetical protein [Thermonema sp.]|uniref:hypothetical protein n=1 Tax=Thermonema sp. TaxID=2231181 RepID=UPI002582CADE|nr:hypothetical protein [Thermonema sp.]
MLPLPGQIITFSVNCAFPTHQSPLDCRGLSEGMSEKNAADSKKIPGIQIFLFIVPCLFSETYISTAQIKKKKKKKKKTQNFIHIFLDARPVAQPKGKTS